MGFLDDLKRQADALREQQTVDGAGLRQRVALTEAACQAALRYFSTLAEQLNVLQPPSPAHYQLDRRHGFQGLPMSDFYADARRKILDRDEVYDHVVLHWQLKTGKTLHLVKDFLPDIEQLEARIRQAAMPVKTEAVRNPDNGKLVEMRYALQADLRAGIRIAPRHEDAMLRVQAQNLERLETLNFELPAQALDEALLDQLAKWITGRPHAFLAGAQGLRRSEG